MASRQNFFMAMMTLCVIAMIVSSAAAQGILQTTVTLTGTCASIGYSTACCPPGAQCQASNGNCNCGADCHTFGDCCPDVHCPTQPRTCRDIGILSCCNETIVGVGNCDLHISADERCSCNGTCHERNDCCSDAESIGCVPRTCAQAGLGAGCCSWGSSSSSCFVGGGNCYCDIYCVVFNDCCDDVLAIVPQCPASNGNARSGVQSNVEQENYLPSYGHPSKARHLEPYPQNVYNDRYAHQREALVARRQRIKTASYPREFRARAHAAVRRPPAY